jgi:hypothetical protein
MTKCPLVLNQIVFELYKKRGNGVAPKDSTPVIRTWKVSDITDKPDIWYAVVSSKFDDDNNPHTRTITPLLWGKVYHKHIVDAVKYELESKRNLIETLFLVIEAEKNYLYAVEKLGILIINNNKYNNPLDIDIF